MQLHRQALTIVTALSFLTRFCGLTHPASVVFDEAHILRFTSWYLSGNYFFDVHPPLGRLFWLAIARLVGWQGGFAPDEAGDSYLIYGVPHVLLRIPAAALSSLVAPLVYSILRELSGSVPACLTAAGLIIFDSAHIAHTRLIYVDGLLCFMVASCLYSYIKFGKSQVWTSYWWIWLSLLGFTLSCTISIKYIGVFTYFTVGTYMLLELLRLFWSENFNANSFYCQILVRSLLLVVIPFGLYLLWFHIHFELLPNSSYGDSYMSVKFQQTLNGSPFAKNETIHMSFWKKWWETQLLIFEENSVSGVDSPHPEQSRPQDWLLPRRGVTFWCSNISRQQIIFIGNVAGWWIAAVVLLASCILLIFQAVGWFFNRSISISNDERQQHFLDPIHFLLTAWAAHYFPFFTMQRALMLHNYLPPHMISTMLVGVMIDWVSNRVESLSHAGKQDKSQLRVEKKMDTDYVPRTTSREDSHSGLIPITTTRQTHHRTDLAWILCWLCLTPTFLFWWFWFPLTYGQPGLDAAAVSRKENIVGYPLRFSYNHHPSSCFP